MTEVLHADVCVVGAGPAALTFALAFARRGHQVVVLERAGTFERSFRGESIAPDSVSVLSSLGVLELLRDRRLLQVQGMQLRDGGRDVLQVRFADLGERPVLPVEIPQPMLLGTLAQEAGAHEGFRLLTGTAVTGLVERDGVVTGVRAVRDGAGLEVRAGLTVGADGRFSQVREWAGLAYRKIPQERDFLWFVVPCPPCWSNDTYRIRINGPSHAMCIPTYPDLVRVGFNIPKNGLGELRAQGIEALHRRIAELAPELEPVVREHVTDWSGTGVLDIFTTVVPDWGRPGLVLVGDAAHTLTPVLAQGINHAIQDGVVLAGLVADALEGRGTPGGALPDWTDPAGRLRQLREPAVRQARALQQRQERLFTFASPPAQWVRRTLYRTLDRSPRIKRRIWSGIYHHDASGPAPAPVPGP